MSENNDLTESNTDGDLAVISPRAGNGSYVLYLLSPAVFLLTTLLGGLRIAEDHSLIFIKPPLICLVLATFLVLIFFRGGMVDLASWFSERSTFLQNAANAAVLFSVFIASAQIFNSLIPETGLTFWLVAFCFSWTLWNNLFLDFEPTRLLRSLMALFGFAFAFKYLLLQNLTAPSANSWLKAIFENPAKEAFTYLLDLPKYSAATGYVQFFAIAFFLLGLYLLPRSVKQ